MKLDITADTEKEILRKTESEYIAKYNEFEADEKWAWEEDGKVVGWFHLYVEEDGVHSGFLFIYVFPEFRRQGIGTAIYRYCEEKLKASGCNWWSSYPESEGADKFALAVGFDYTNTNSYMVYEGGALDYPEEGIRPCVRADYPAAVDLWRREYAAMHVRIGLHYVEHEQTSEQIEAIRESFYKELGDHFVIEENGRIIATGTLFSDGSGIGSLAVDREFAGRGHGTRLAAYITKECIRRGTAHPCLYCEAGNDDAMHVYKKLGYVERSRETVAVKN